MMLSAVLVPVPEAERLVSRHRARFDRAAVLGVPAHVTVLYPFVPPPAITAGTLELLAGAVASVGAFDCQFPVTAWFGPDVLWLAPRPDEPFRGRTPAGRPARLILGCQEVKGLVPWRSWRQISAAPIS